MKVNQLHDVCLLEIINYLPLLDRISVMKVDKKWESVGQQSFHGFKSIDFRKTTWSSSNVHITNAVFDEVLSVLGENLTSIDFSYGTNLGSSMIHCIYSIAAVQSLCKLCPNIQKLRLIDMKSTCVENDCKNDQHKVVPHLIRYAENLTHFAINFHHFCDSSEEWSELFEKMKNLKSLQLNYTCLHSLSIFLNKLPCTAVEELIIKETTLDDNNDLLEFIKTKCNLHTIVFEEVKNLDLQALTAVLAKHQKNLKNITLSISNSEGIKSTWWRNMTKLVDLEELNFENSCPLVYGPIRNIIKKCRHLTTVNISYCRGMRNEDITAIATLPKLRCLHMTGLKYVTTLPFENTKSLEILDCRDCSMIDLKILREFFPKAPHIKLLNGHKMINGVLQTSGPLDRIEYSLINTYCSKKRSVLKKLKSFFFD